MALAFPAQASQPAFRSALRLDDDPALWLLSPLRHPRDGGAEQARSIALTPAPPDPQPVWQWSVLPGAGLDPLGDSWGRAGFVLPAWLERLDPDRALAIVRTLGCGRGLPCSPGVPFPAEAFVALWDAMEPSLPEIPAWKCKERPTIVMRGRERASFVLVRCDGSIADDAWLRLSLLARPPDVPAPVDPPDEPEPGAGPGEWLPGVHLVDPRLLWLLSRISARFRQRGIYLYSGYRPRRERDPARAHGSLHGQGRALDIAVQGVSDAELLAACAALPDVGCGYYPHNRFVHVDVRPRHSGSFVWVDAAWPGEPSRYVASWPGVVEDGRLIWTKAVWKKKAGQG